MPGDSLLRRFAGDPGYDRVAARIAAALPQVRRAREAHRVHVDGLVPEGLAADLRDGALFVGDMNGRAILRIDRRGRVTRFADRLDLRPLGMAVDPARGLLWVATSDSFIAGSPPRSALLAFDLTSGRLRQRVSPGEARSLNDLAIAPDGTIFVTDSLGGALFRLDPGGVALAPVTPEGAMSYPNGVALSADARFVFVAQGVAIRRIEAATGEIVSLALPPGLALLGIDGLYGHRGRLVAVQNGGTPGRVLLLGLSADLRAISEYRLLEAGHPDFDIPTTGAIVGDRFVFIANSQLTRLADDGTIAAGPPLAPVALLEVALPRDAENARAPARNAAAPG